MPTPTGYYSMHRNYGSYTGSVVTLRAYEGGTTQEFKLVDGLLVTNDVDEDNVLDWLTENNSVKATVQKLFDQSGNANHGEQLTASRQPGFHPMAISGKPAMYFSNTLMNMPLEESAMDLKDATAFATFQLETLVDQFIIGSSGGTRWYMRANATDWRCRVGNASIEDGGTSDLNPHVMDLRDNNGAFQGRIDKTTFGSGSQTSSTAEITNLNIGSFNAGESGFLQGWVSEVRLFNSSLSDVERDAEVDDMLDGGLVDTTRITRTEIDGTILEPDGIDSADITGNGFPDYLIAQENGIIYWYEQTSLGAFTRRTIRGSSYSGAKCEGAKWIKLDDDGTDQWVAVILDQDNGEIRVYRQDTPGTPTGTWTEGVIQSSRANLQDVHAWDIDGDGEEEIVYSWEGNASGQGGINWLDYDGTGSLTSSGSYTDHVMIQHEGAWWIADERKDLSGDTNATDIVFTARDSGRNAATVPGVYWLEEPSTVTDAWTLHTIDNTDADFQHIEWGNFANDSGGTDLLVHDTAGAIKYYDGSSGYGSPVSPTTVIAGLGDVFLYNIKNYGNPVNGRDQFLAFDDKHLSVWQWTGTSYGPVIFARVTEKSDDRIILQDVDGDGIDEIFAPDSIDDSFSYYKIIEGVPDAGGVTPYTGTATTGVGSGASIQPTLATGFVVSIASKLGEGVGYAPLPAFGQQLTATASLGSGAGQTPTLTAGLGLVVEAGVGEGSSDVAALTAGQALTASAGAGFGEGQTPTLTIGGAVSLTATSGLGVGLGQTPILTAGSSFSGVASSGMGTGTGSLALLSAGFVTLLQTGSGSGLGQEPILTTGGAFTGVANSGSGQGVGQAPLLTQGTALVLQAGHGLGQGRTPVLLTESATQTFFGVFPRDLSPNDLIA